MDSERTLLVTGFNSFANHAVNASWEAVKELYEMRDYFKERYNVKLVVDCITVAYDYVVEKVPELWKEHEPAIVLHVGVSAIAKCLTIECQAHADGYCRPDVDGKYPSKKCENPSECLKTGVDVEDLCRRVNEKNSDKSCCRACVSKDAGRYLCEYIYYQSLCKNPQCTLFIHVPDIHVYASKTTAEGLRDIIETLLEIV